MTRRERLERKPEKRADWAEKADKRSDAEHAKSSAYVAGIPFGQPILVGHHSEKRHRGAVEKSWNALGRAVEESKLAEHHRDKAAGLERQLDGTIFSDDPDAVEQLRAKVAALRAENVRDKALNAHWKKHKTMAGYPGITDEAAARLDEKIRADWPKRPVAAYTFSNRGAVIRQAEKRITEVEGRQKRARQAEENGGVTVERPGNGYAIVTFAEKPSRDMLSRLRAAGYWWGRGSWAGPVDKLPEGIEPSNTEIPNIPGEESLRNSEPTAAPPLIHAGVSSALCKSEAPSNTITTRTDWVTCDRCLQLMAERRADFMFCIAPAKCAHDGRCPLDPVCGN